MIEHAVEDDLDATGGGIGHQRVLEIAVAAEVAADRKVIARVVAVVGAGLEHRVEIDDGDAEPLQVGQLRVYALQVATEVVAAFRPFGAGRTGVDIMRTIAFGQGVPQPVLDLRVCCRLELRGAGVGRRRVVVAEVGRAGIVGGAAVAEAIRENLVHHAVLHPGHDRERRVYRVDAEAVVLFGSRRHTHAVVAVGGVGIIGGGRAVAHDEAVVGGAERIGRVAALPVVAGVALPRQRRVVAIHILRHRGHGGAGILAHSGVIQAQVDARHVVVEGAEAHRDGGAGIDRAERHAIEAIARVVAQAGKLHIVVVARRATQHLHRHGMAGRVERDAGVLGVAEDKGHVVAVGIAVADIPILVERHLELIAAGNAGRRVVGVHAVAVNILQPGFEALRLPIAGAADLALERAGGGSDGGVAVVGDPVAGLVEIELDRRAAGGHYQRDVVATQRSVQTIAADRPRIVNDRLVLVVAGGQGHREAPHAVRRAAGHVGGGAVLLPVATTGDQMAEAAGDGHGVGVIERFGPGTGSVVPDGLRGPAAGADRLGGLARHTGPRLGQQGYKGQRDQRAAKLSFLRDHKETLSLP